MLAFVASQETTSGEKNRHTGGNEVLTSAAVIIRNGIRESLDGKPTLGILDGLHGLAVGAEVVLDAEPRRRQCVLISALLPIIFNVNASAHPVFRRVTG